MNPALSSTADESCICEGQKGEFDQRRKMANRFVKP